MSTGYLAPCQPIIEWADDKMQFLSEIKSRTPKQFNTYYEPFFGGGALFFDLQPDEAVINNSNSQLINIYQQVKTNPQQIMGLLELFQDVYNSLPTDTAKTQLYQKFKSTFNQVNAHEDYSVRSAAIFIFLNKTCFKGLYRVNSNGEFFVPHGHKNQVKLYDPKNIRNVSQCLSAATILNGDFETACTTAEGGDFVFFNSPYYSSYDTKQPGEFSQQDHIRLSELFRTLTNKGVYCMLIASNEKFIHRLYTGFNIEVVDVEHNRSKRTIITNY